MDDDDDEDFELPDLRETISAAMNDDDDLDDFEFDDF